jgi:hypothetical protein
MEFKNFLGPIIWVFNVSAFFTEGVRRRPMEDAARILLRVCHRRVRGRLSP